MCSHLLGPHLIGVSQGGSINLKYSTAACKGRKRLDEHRNVAALVRGHQLLSHVLGLFARHPCIYEAYVSGMMRIMAC